MPSSDVFLQSQPKKKHTKDNPQQLATEYLDPWLQGGTHTHTHARCLRAVSEVSRPRRGTAARVAGTRRKSPTPWPRAAPRRGASAPPRWASAPAEGRPGGPWGPREHDVSTRTPYRGVSIDRPLEVI